MTRCLWVLEKPGGRGIREDQAVKLVEKRPGTGVCDVGTAMGFGRTTAFGFCAIGRNSPVDRRCDAVARGGHDPTTSRNHAAEDALSRDLAEVRFSRLYRDHEREILRYALRRSAAPEDAADVVAETFLVAWRRLGEVPGGGDARLWLYATARRVLASHRRGGKRRTRLAEQGSVLEALGGLGTPIASC